MAMITRQILGERCSTKEAMQLLELGGVLECIPHDVDPDARLTNVAVAMRRSEWWWSVPATEYDGKRLPRGYWIQGQWQGRGDVTIGEFNAH